MPVDVLTPNLNSKLAGLRVRPLPRLMSARAAEITNGFAEVLDALKRKLTSDPKSILANLHRRYQSDIWKVGYGSSIGAPCTLNRQLLEYIA